MTSKLLLDEPPLIILPTLACALGLKGAIITQQIHYWISYHKRKHHLRNYHNGLWWTWNTIHAWRQQFPFWSTSTIKRTLQQLRAQQVVLVANFNLRRYDRTLWYSLNYDHIDRMIDDLEELQGQPSAHFEQMDMVNLPLSTRSDCTKPSGQSDPMEQGNMTQPIPETSRDYSQETDRHHAAAELWHSCLNELQHMMTKACWYTWFSQTGLQLTGSQATILCKDAYVQDWLSTRWATRLTELLSAHLQIDDIVVTFTILSPSQPSPPSPVQDDTPAGQH